MERGSEGNGRGCGFVGLPEACMANIISFTTPVDACRVSVVSKILRSIADSDDVWERFLPRDYVSIISGSPSLLAPSSKKALYLALSDRPIIIDDGKKSFQLERRSGKKCYMLSARDLCIIWGETPYYWIWTSRPDSRFEVAELVAVCRLEIHGMINSRRLSSNTQYGAYLVYKMKEACGFETYPADVSVGIDGYGDEEEEEDDDRRRSGKKVCLDPSLQEWELDPSFRGLEVKGAEERRDGWLEVEMGEVFVSGVPDEPQPVHMSLLEVLGGQWKRGLILQGIELRPKPYHPF